MSDIIDDANDRAQLELERAIAAARGSNGIEYAQTGACLNCETPVEGAAFCDAECREDYERRRRAQGRRW
jgi:hypothetical protein